MVTKIEGILISKMPYKERHLIGKVLLRTGHNVSCLFYGGQGGGKSNKGTILELGNMLKIELQRVGKASTSELYSAKEWKSIWMHQNIRNQYRAYYVMCLYFEMMLKLSPPIALKGYDSSHDLENEGLFRVASNALVYLDDNLPVDDRESANHFAIFLGKLLIELGIYPILDRCVLSDFALDLIKSMILMPEHGGFADRASTNEVNRVECAPLRDFLAIVWKTPYREVKISKKVSKDVVDELFSYFCYQFQIERGAFKSLGAVL